jgi:hypothetical protein
VAAFNVPADRLSAYPQPAVPVPQVYQMNGACLSDRDTRTPVISGRFCRQKVKPHLTKQNVQLYWEVWNETQRNHCSKKI